jgi:hypothetical protein
MKTAMQELIDNLESIDINVPNGVKLIFIEKEKQQIIDACWYGHDIKHEYFNPIHYIDKTYPQNK